MKLSKCKYGEVVTDKNGRIGHIVGLDVQYDFNDKGNRGETIPLVQFSCEKHPVKIHYRNIELYKD